MSPERLVDRLLPGVSAAIIEVRLVVVASSGLSVWLSRMETARAVASDVLRAETDGGGGMPRIEFTGDAAAEFGTDGRNESPERPTGAGNALILVNALLVFSMPREAKSGGRARDGLRSDDVSDASALAGLRSEDGVRNVEARRLLVA